MADPATYKNRATGVADFDAPFNEVAKTGNYTIVAGDNCTRFTNGGASGAVIFTLPAIKPGYVFEFVVKANQNLTVASSEGGNIIGYNNNAVNNMAFSTSSQLYGGFLRFESSLDGGKWYVKNFSPGNTITLS
jgi:hypothetical protein